uniref:Scaffolding protein n=1 Tax=viral metagenome TaxID=1070528 RepID=A0A6M3LAE9_9ZZZZ
MADSEEEKKDAENQEETKETKTEAEPGDDSKDDLGELSADDFLKAVKDAGLDKSLDKYLQSEADRRVTEAIKTHEKKLRDKEKQRKEKETKEKAEANMSDSDKKVSELEESLTKLTNMMSEFMGKQQAEKLDVLKKAAIKDAGLPEAYVGLLDVDSEKDIAERIKLIQEGFNKLKDREVQAWAEGQKQPFRSTGGSTSDNVAKVQKYIKEKAKLETSGAAAEQLGLTK